MSLDLVLIATFMANQRFPVNSFVAASKEFKNDPNLTSAISNMTYAPNKYTRLMYASKVGDIERAITLITAGANINAESITDGATALSFACEMGHTQIVRILLESGADIKKCMITMANNTETCSILIKAGADVNARDITGYTALMRATFIGDKELVDLFIKSGASLDVQCTDIGNTALIIACKENYTEIADLLIKAGANVNKATSYNDATPLMWAAFNGNMEITRNLVSAGADVTEEQLSAKGWDASMYAKINKHKSVYEYLKSVKNLTGGS